MLGGDMGRKGRERCRAANLGGGYVMWATGGLNERQCCIGSTLVGLPLGRVCRREERIWALI